MLRSFRKPDVCCFAVKHLMIFAWEGKTPCCTSHFSLSICICIFSTTYTKKKHKKENSVIHLVCCVWSMITLHKKMKPAQKLLKDADYQLLAPARHVWAQSWWVRHELLRGKKLQKPELWSISPFESWLVCLGWISLDRFGLVFNTSDLVCDWSSVG